MATRGNAVAGTERPQSRRGVGLSPELVAILAVGIALAGMMLTMMMDSSDKGLSALREDVRELRAGQVELRERMARVEAKLDVLVGDWPPKKDQGTAGRETSSRRG